MVTDVSIDPAGNVWVANNWNNLEAAAHPDPPRPTSTWGGGSGFTVIYGVAAPVKPPRIGPVQRYEAMQNKNAEYATKLTSTQTELAR
jgi:hypothetical protein